MKVKFKNYKIAGYMRGVINAKRGRRDFICLWTGY